MHIHRRHARRGLPVNQNTNLTPPTQAPFELHHTAAVSSNLLWSATFPNMPAALGVSSLFELAGGQ